MKTEKEYEDEAMGEIVEMRLEPEDDHLKDYQKWTATTAIYPEAGTGQDIALAYVSLGLAGEAGEIANKIKKVVRDGDYNAEDLADELGDVLYYVARMAAELGTSLNLIARDNRIKLEDRFNRGVISGNGDNR